MRIIGWICGFVTIDWIGLKLHICLRGSLEVMHRAEKAMENNLIGNWEER